MSAAAPQRGTIFLEDARILEHRAYPGAQYVMRLAAARCAAAATPGSFVHLTCGPDLPMRRPLSIMRASPREGWVEVLYKVVGHGLAELALRKAGEAISCLGPIGRGFTPHSARPRLLMVGGGVGIPPMVFLAEAIAAVDGAWKPLVLMGSELPFPFELADARLPAAGLAAAPVLGVVFALGWSPCIGPALAVVINLGLNEGTALRGGVLGFAYALGLGVPFVIAGLAFSSMTRTVGLLRRHQVAVMRIGGLMMVAVGVLLVTGWWDQLMARLTVWVGSFTTVI